MTQPFEELPATLTAEELLDKAFSRGARAGRAKSGVDAQQSMLQTAANILSDNLENVVTGWPDFGALDPFYCDLADAIAGVDELRAHLNELGWASRKATDIRQEYERRLRSSDPDTARKLRKQAYARLADVVREVEDDIDALAGAREELRSLPDIRPDEPTIAVAGYPNVGKSSFVNSVTRAANETASYPFTTTRINVGHVTHEHIRYQIVDTPGLLDRPPAERNEIESLAVSALTHAADAVLVLLDASGECGYPADVQRNLFADVRERFDVPVIPVCNKADRSRDLAADHYMSVTGEENVREVLAAAIEAVGYEAELPFEG